MVVIFFALPAETLMGHNSSITTATIADPDGSYVSPTTIQSKDSQYPEGSEYSGTRSNAGLSTRVLKLILVPIPNLFTHYIKVTECIRLIWLKAIYPVSLSVRYYFLGRYYIYIKGLNIKVCQSPPKKINQRNNDA